MIPVEERDELVATIRERLLNRFPEHADKPGMCLYLSHLLAEELYSRGEIVILQAGNLQWPIVPVDEFAEEGESPEMANIHTHFAYIWSPDEPRSEWAMENGYLPEMHAWVGTFTKEKTAELIDLATGRFPEMSAKLNVGPWRSALPPDYLWANELPLGVTYKPVPDATMFACRTLIERFQPAYLRRGAYGK